VLQNTTSQTCLSVFSTAVYDHFGDLSVLSWGNEVPCNSYVIPINAVPINVISNVTNTTNSSNPGILVGGYSNIPNLNDKNVQQAAAYAVKELVKSNLKNQYPFLRKIQRPNAQYTWKVVRGKQQVVAGMNYKLTIKFRKMNGRRIGGLQAIVYDHFGSLSVTKWGKRVRCMRLM
jgi:Aspartic acid proteinase inhibitor